MSKFVVRETHSAMGSFINAVEGRQEEWPYPVYVRYIKMDTRRGCYGIMRVVLTDEQAKAKTWATREGAEKVAEQYTTDTVTYAVEEI